MSTMTHTSVTTQVYRVYIKATPQAIWDAITRPEWTQKYGYHGIAEYDLRPGGKYRALAPAEMQSKTAEQVASTARLQEGGGGWSWILSDLKTLLETGEPAWS